MPRSATDNEFKLAKSVIDEVGEPAFSRIINLLNSHLKQFNLQVGAELTWFVDNIASDDDNSNNSNG